MQKSEYKKEIEISKKIIIDKGQYILSKTIDELSNEDKTLQEFINYILKDGFSTRYLKLPININTDKISLNCLQKYVELIYEIFLMAPDKRKKIYSSEPQEVNKINPTILKKIKELKLSFDKKTKDLTTYYSEDKQYILERLKDKLKKQKGILSLLELYQICFCSLFSHPDILKYMFFKMNKDIYIYYFGEINYNYYGANFDNNICLEIISLYLEELKNRNESNLIIYINIIFHFTWLFNKDYNEIINKNYIKDAIQKTYFKIKEKNVKDKNIIGPIFLSYLLIKLNIPKKFLNIKNIDEISNFYLKNEIQSNKQRNNNSSTEISEKSKEELKKNNNNNKSSDDANSIEKIIEINNNMESDESQTKTIEELNRKIKFLTLSYEEHEKKINENTKIINENKKEISGLKGEMEKIKIKLNNIMLRDKLINFLNTIGGEFNQAEKDIISNDRTKRGEASLMAFKRKYWLYFKRERFKLIQELIEKVGNLYNKGNLIAHTLDLSQYKDEISAFKTQNKINFVINDEIVVLLKLCEISSDKINVLSNFMMKCFDSDFNTIIKKGQDVIINFMLDRL